MHETSRRNFQAGRRRAFRNLLLYALAGWALGYMLFKVILAVV